MERGNIQEFSERFQRNQLLRINEVIILTKQSDIMEQNWENFISLNSQSEPNFKLLEPADQHISSDAWTHTWSELEYDKALSKDHYPLPSTIDREGYFGANHFSYWASGLSDMNDLLSVAKKYDLNIDSYLDFGCATGRVTRHFGIQHPNIRTLGCDINRHHVLWCNKHLPNNVTTFQNHSIPNLPLADGSISFISAYSVFTHIEAFETTWLMEFDRILKPGGIAWITVHTDLTLSAMEKNWPLYNAVESHPLRSDLLNEEREFSGDRLILRLNKDKSYSSNVFYKFEYIQSAWSHFFEVLEFKHKFPRFQDFIVLKKK